MSDVRSPRNDKVITVLVNAHREFLQFLERRIGNRAIAEEILQGAFAKSIERLESLRDDDRAIAWFYRILRNAVIDYRRRFDTAEKSLMTFAQEMEVQADPPEAMHAAVCLCISDLASSLKPEYADILKRVEVDGLTIQAYAQESGISSNNAAVRAHRAREALRRQVADFCRTCSEHGCFDCSCQ